MKFLGTIVFACMLCMSTVSAHAVSLVDSVLIPKESEWQYAFKPGYVYRDTAMQLGYNFVDWQNLDWETGQAGFGKNQPTNPVRYTFATEWVHPSSLLLQKTISYNEHAAQMGTPYEVGSIAIEGYADETYTMFINGYKVSADYTWGAFSSTIGADALRGIWNQYGDNLIQIIVTDRGEPSFFDMKLTAQTAATPIPAAVWLFGSGLAGLVAVRRRLLTN